MGLKKLIVPIAVASLFLFSPTDFGRHDQYKYPRKDAHLSPGPHLSTTFTSYFEDLDNPRKGKDDRVFVKTEWSYVFESKIARIDENEGPKKTNEATSPPPYKGKD